MRTGEYDKMRSTRHAVIAIGLVLALLVPSWSVASAQSSGAPDDQRQRYIVQLAPAAGVDAIIAQALDPQASTVLQKYSTVINGFAVELPPRAAEALARHPLVLNVMPDPVVEIDAQTTPTGITRMGTLSNPDAKIDGADERVNINVAVIDTGSGPHADLNVVGGVDCTGSGTYNDQNGHGTHVAGTIGALDNNSGVVGVAPGARIWSVKVLDAQGSGYGSWILCGIDWVSKNLSTTNIKIANMSLGGKASVTDDNNCGKTQRDSIHQAICNSVAAGVTYTVAAGNDGVDASTYFPAMYNEVVTVSALVDTDGKPGGLGSGTSAGADDTLASFSNFGADVDVIAPGVNILSTVPGGYANYSGTSMASPHAAGAAALYLIANPGSSPAQIRTGLMSTGSASVWSGDRDSSKEPLIDVSAYRGSTPPPTDEPEPEPDPLVPALIDAETVSISGPSGVTQGGTATVSASVRNNGALAATVTVAFSESPGNATGSTSVSLAAGASATVNFNWATTNTTATGNHTVTVSASVANDTNAANNAKSRTIAVSAPVTRDAAVTSISAPTSVTRGGSVTVSAGVRNNGSASATISINFKETPGGASQTKSVTLGAGASTTVSFSWATTSSTATGAHTLSATATVANDTNAGNNSKSRSITVSAPTSSAKSMNVSNITLSSTKSSSSTRISTRVYIKSGSAVLSGARVTIRYTDPNGATVSSSATTNRYGYAAFSRSVTRKGAYSVQVTGVTKSGYSYAPSSNVVTKKSLTVR